MKKVVVFALFFIVLTAAAVVAGSPPSVSLSVPTDGRILSIDNITFKYVPTPATTSGDIVSCTINFDKGDIHFEEGTNVITNRKSNSFVVSLTNGNWTWHVECYSNETATPGVSSNYTLIVALDVDPPNVNLDLSRTHVNKSKGYFYYTPMDHKVGIRNCKLIIDGEIIVTDTSIQNNTLQYFWGISLSAGRRMWQVNCTDAMNNTGHAGPTSIIVKDPGDYPEITLRQPATGVLYTTRFITFTYTPVSSSALVNCVLFRNNTVILSESAVTNNSLNSFKNVEFQEGKWKWQIGCFNEDRLSENSSIRNIYINTSVLLTKYLYVTLLSPADSQITNSSTVDFSFNVSAVNVMSSCSLLLNGSNRRLLSSVSKTVTNYFNDVDISNGHWTWTVSCTDTANFTQAPSVFNLTVDAPTEAEVTEIVVLNATAAANDTANVTTNGTTQNVTEDAAEMGISGDVYIFFRDNSFVIFLTLLVVGVGGFVFTSKGFRKKFSAWLEKLHFKHYHEKPEETEGAAYKRLDGYVKNFMQKGFSKEKIYKHLETYGWKKEDIDRVFGKSEEKQD